MKNKNESKKVLIVINTMGRAGAEKSLISLLKSFDYSQVHISLLSVVGRGELFTEVPKEVKILNKKFSTESVLGTSGSLYIAKQVLKRMFRNGYIFKFIPYAIKNIAAQVKTKRFQPDKLLWLLLAETTETLNKEYDLAVAFLEGASTYYVAERSKAKKKISFVHVNYEKAGYSKKLDSVYYKKMDYICCISDAVKQVFQSIYPEHSGIIRVFPNIILAEDIRSEAKKHGGFSDDFNGIRILTVARLHHQKGLDVAVPAFAKLVAQGYDNVKWYVLGDGTEKAHLLSLIKKYGLENKFILLGSSPNPYTYMLQSDIYIQPSRFEGFPLTLQEALILNKPCITTNFEGVYDLLQNGINAVIIEFSEENISNSIKELIDNKDMRKNLSLATMQLKPDLNNKLNNLYDIINGKHWKE